jgi:hypothetical protein
MMTDANQLTTWVLLPAGNRTVQPHLAIGSVTKKPQRPNKDLKSKRKAVWCVFVCKGHANYVHRLPMASSNGGANSRAAKKKLTSKPAGLRGDTYRDIVHKFLQEQDFQQGDSVQTRSMAKVVLLHDRHPAHTSSLFSAYAHKIKLTTKLLPPCSPDLTPLDSGFFGTIKTRVESEVRREGLTWDVACERMETKLKTEPSLNYIADLPLRWQACVNVKGWHIEPELHRLKKETARQSQSDAAGH